jgi:hypothetical protein
MVGALSLCSFDLDLIKGGQKKDRLLFAINCLQFREDLMSPSSIV